jgi:hypothetical protein
MLTLRQAPQAMESAGVGIFLEFEPRLPSVSVTRYGCTAFGLLLQESRVPRILLMPKHTNAGGLRVRWIH